ncbi:hypothetical protein GCM10009839_06250 [Catenulispora yoronensis]|uniref:Nucleotidyltransferase n=1 Tax=Catenulispora yoronensis TaxID=450799 RepID=A0ABN2TM36_9ACTN
MGRNPQHETAPRRPAAVDTVREVSAQAASAARVRRHAAPYDLSPTGWLTEDANHRGRTRGVRDRAAYLDPASLAPRRRTDAELQDPRLARLDAWLTDRVNRVKATDEELATAEFRAQAVIGALDRIYPGAEVYRTGSIAHGDAMHPLNDVDLGVILTDRPELGPDGLGPRAEMRHVAGELVKRLKPTFPKLSADPEGKRSVVLTFNAVQGASDPDFTCDVIIALPGPDQTLLIPNTDLRGGWDQNDPRGHVDRVQRVDAASGGSLSRTVRLAKHWRDRHGKPLYSWNIKTLALEALSGASHPFEGLYRFFEHSAGAVAEGPTENPGSMAYPPPTVAGNRGEATRQLLDALARLELARLAALAGKDDAAEQALGRFFGDGIDGPGGAAFSG